MAEDAGAATKAPEAPAQAATQLPELDAEIMKTTRLYELCILFDPAEATRTWDKLEEYVRDMVEKKYGNHVQQIDKWADSRKLAYEIKGLKRGTYMVVWFRGKPETIADIDRDLRLDDKPIRHIVIAHEEEPPTVGKTSEDFEAARPEEKPKRY